MSSFVSIADSMEITQITLGGVLIQDPMTLLTDIVLGVECLILAALLRSEAARSRISKLFMWFLILMGIGSIEGGIINHGWYYLLGPGGKAPMVLIVGSSLPFLMLGNVLSLVGRNVMSDQRIKWLKILIAVEMGAWWSYLFTWPIELLDFKAMVPHLFAGLILFVAVLQLYARVRDPHPARQQMLWAIASLLPVGLVQVLKISPDKWFNMFDLVHVLLLIPMYLIYLAGKAFADLEPNTISHLQEANG